MKFGQYSVYDVLVFDENENLAVNLDTLEKVDIYYSEATETYYLVARDALLNTDFLKYIGKTEKQTDYSSILNNKIKITIGKRSSVPCKLIAKSIIRNTTTQEDQEIILEFPKAKVISKPSFSGDNYNVSQFDVVFEIEQLANGDFYNIYI